MSSALKTEDIEIFAHAVVEFFDTTMGERAQVRSAWLLEQEEPVLRNDYNGLIEVSGGFAGSICFSAPHRLLDFVLLASGDQQYTEAKYLDVVGEVANVLSGRARSYFGDTLSISPPRAFKRDSKSIPRLTSGTPYVIPIAWRTFEAMLVVHLSRV